MILWLTASSSKNSSSSNVSTSLGNEVDNYITNRGTNQRAIKSFIAEITRVYVGVSGSNMKLITSYSLQDEKFDQFFIPSTMLQKLRDQVVMR